MQSVSSRIWTRIAVLISYGDNDYTTGTSNEGLLHIPQSSGIARTSTSDILVSYIGHLLGEGSYSSAEVQSAYSTAPTEWAKDWLDEIVKLVFWPFVSLEWDTHRV